MDRISTGTATENAVKSTLTGEVARLENIVGEIYSTLVVGNPDKEQELGPLEDVLVDALRNRLIRVNTRLLEVAEIVHRL